MMTFNAATPILLQEETHQRGALEKKQREEHALKAQTELLALAKAHDDEVAANAITAYFASAGGHGRGRGRCGGGGGHGGHGGGGGGDWKQAVTCYRCGNKGHISRECPLNWKDQVREKLHLAQVAYDALDVDDEHLKVLLTKRTTNALHPKVLVVDSGASRHIKKERTAFITYTVLKKPIPIQLGDDSEILVIGVGTICKHVKTPTGVDTMHFTRTLHAELSGIRLYLNTAHFAHFRNSQITV
jgi:hypothetical protein